MRQNSKLNLQRGEMTTFTQLSKDDLDQEVSPEDVEAQDACVGQEIKENHSLFGNLLNNLLSGGGRTRRSKIAGKMHHYLTLIGH